MDGWGICILMIIPNLTFIFAAKEKTYLLLAQSNHSILFTHLKKYPVLKGNIF